MLPMTVDNMDDRRVNGNVYLDLKPSGELSSGKLGRWVRRGAVGKVTASWRLTRWQPTLPYIHLAAVNLGSFDGYSRFVLFITY